MRTTILLAILCLASQVSASRPNVIYIMADDLGIGDVKCFGKDRCQIPTPGFDRLAKEGMMFTDAHAITSFCVPTRMAIMTGRYPWRFRRPRPDGRWGFLNPRIETSRSTLGSMLRKAGYRTGYVGKWHLGTKMQTVDGKNQGPKNVDYTKPLTIGPASYGFDYSWILPGSLDMYPYVFVKNHRFVGKVTAQKGWSAFNRVGPAEESFEDHQVLDVFASQAEQFIRRNAARSKSGRPFFLYLALTAPHTPTSPSKSFKGKSGLGVYGDFVAETDHCVTRVLKALDRHKLAENTLVIATSDHGAAAYAGNILRATPLQIHQLEKQGHYSSGIYRGFKFSVYEGGLRVPFVARWPKVIRQRSICNRLICLGDLMRTLADVCGRKLPPEEAPDSISYHRLMKNPQANSPRKSLVMKSTRAFAIRRGKWKLALCPGSGCNGHWGNRTRQQEAWENALKEFGSKPKRKDLFAAPFVQLFDMDKDPGEHHNLAKQKPQLVQQLVAELRRLNQAGTSQHGQTLKDFRRVNLLGGVPKFVFK